MKNLFGLAMAVTMALGAAGCADLGVDGQQGGANANDRSSGGGEGEKLLTGAMTISPNGKYIVAARNTSTVLVDVGAKSYQELNFMATRWVFSKTRDVAYAMLANREAVIALDLTTGKELWRTTPALGATDGATLMRVTTDDKTLIIGDYDRVLFMRVSDGDVLGSAKVGEKPVDIEFLPEEKRAIVVGGTSWATGKPLTKVSLVDIGAMSSSSIEIPNCAAPVALVKDGSRAMVSPTFCTPESSGVENPAGGWTNPDPVSMIDVDQTTGTLKFIKNLPGFGPVAMMNDGKAIAYLDMKRIDRAMFDDQSQIPGAGAPQFHLMSIDPASMKFDLNPIGDILPRFAPSKDGHSLLVDGSVVVSRSEATAKVTFDGSSVKAEFKVFGSVSNSMFGVFDLSTKQYTSFTGPAAALDRFVQIGDGSRVYTLKDNGRGGDLFAVDVSAKTTIDMGMGLRDVGILPDGITLVLRIRLEPTADGRLQEKFCFSHDGRTCDAGEVQYTGLVPQHDP